MCYTALCGVLGGSTYSFFLPFPLFMTIPNTELTKRIRESNLHEEDARMVERIFAALLPERQIAILDGWDAMAARIKASRQALEHQKEVLLTQAIQNIQLDLNAIGYALDTTTNV